jgi:hypothetical protein
MPATKRTIGFALAVTGGLMLTAMTGTAFARSATPHSPPIYCDASCQANHARPIPRPPATNSANTITRDHRTGATAAPGGPPPAAAIGTRPTASQVAAQTPAVRDHRQAK